MNKFLTFFLPFLLAPNIFFSQNADCNTAKDICKKESLSVRAPKGEGSDIKEADFMHCFMNGDNFGQAEENSTWIKFEIKEGGTFAFSITPNERTDDIDFVVFRLPANGDCARKEVVRCMAAGERGENAEASRCMGSTGLRSGETDSSTDAGCSDKNDNTWLAPLKTIKGEKYVLLISNVSGPRGFTVSFSGTAKLPCEEKKPVQPPVAKKTPPTTPPTPPVTATTDVIVEKEKPKKTEKPDKINGRDVELGETVKIKNHKIKLKIWDSQIEDGDVVSIYLGDKVLLNHHKLTTKPEEFEFELPAGIKEHYLTVYADDFGRSEPNTAAIIINDGVKEQRIDLTAGRKKQESVKIITE
jgi:hypothetical protein